MGHGNLNYNHAKTTTGRKVMKCSQLLCSTCLCSFSCLVLKWMPITITYPFLHWGLCSHNLTFSHCGAPIQAVTKEQTMHFGINQRKEKTNTSIRKPLVLQDNNKINISLLTYPQPYSRIIFVYMSDQITAERWIFSSQLEWHEPNLQY